MLSYFEKTALDEEFFNTWIGPRLPQEIFDMHLHVTRPCDTFGVPQSIIDGDWVMQCGFQMEESDLDHYCRTLWPGRRVWCNAFPMPIRGVDLMSANRHLAALLQNQNADAPVQIRAAEMAIDPSFSPEECEEMLLRCGFLGYKPYPDLVSGRKGADIRIPDFLPDAFMHTLDRHKRAVTIHLPRAERIASPLNIRELLELRQKFPDAKIIIAHYGRSYNIEVIQKAYAEMGRDIEGFYFDNAAVLNPQVHRFMLEHIPQDRIFYGSDMPLLLWHGKRTWENGTYHNHAREQFRWNANAPESEAERSGYTFFLYEQAKHLLDAIYSVGDRALAEKVYCKNAKAFVTSVLNR